MFEREMDNCIVRRSQKKIKRLTKMPYNIKAVVLLYVLCTNSVQSTVGFHLL